MVRKIIRVVTFWDTQNAPRNCKYLKIKIFEGLFTTKENSGMYNFYSIQNILGYIFDLMLVLRFL